MIITIKILDKEGEIFYYIYENENHYQEGGAMSEEMLIAHCAPTLAGIKTGNLFNCKCKSNCYLQKQIEIWNQKLNPKGVHITSLKTMNERTLVYVYRPKKLEKDISCQETKTFLNTQGYTADNMDHYIQQLSNRLYACDEFPHEIGLFLGYPLEDVKAFIENKGKGCKCVGYWKVYGNEQKAKDTFEKYRRCTCIYRKKLQEGRTLDKLTIAG